MKVSRRVYGFYAAAIDSLLKTNTSFIKPGNAWVTASFRKMNISSNRNWFRIPLNSIQQSQLCTTYRKRSQISESGPDAWNMLNRNFSSFFLHYKGFLPFLTVILTGQWEKWLEQTLRTEASRFHGIQKTGNLYSQLALNMKMPLDTINAIKCRLNLAALTKINNKLQL